MHRLVFKEWPMAKRKKRSLLRHDVVPGHVAHAPQGTLRTCQIGALPILNHFLRRMRLQQTLRDLLGPDDPHAKLSTNTSLLVLLRNLLVAREPVYGVGQWAARYAPDVLGLLPDQIPLLNDDRMGRSLGGLFRIDSANRALVVAAAVVHEFDIDLERFHNDSTTITFCGAYPDAATEKRFLGRPTLAITFGHNKDHRPDLKQLLYILTVSEDGGVPLHFRVQSGNTTDDQTHRHTWDLLCKLVGRTDFLYVADCKLATRDNMAYLAQRKGRFLTVLPRTRSEDAVFRQRLRQGQVRWQPLWEKTDEHGQVRDRFAISDGPALTAEGYRLVWYHSTRKAELDAAARATHIEKTLQRLGQLQAKITSPRTRWRQPEKVSRLWTRS